jgi:hypothetical protein
VGPRGTALFNVDSELLRCGRCSMPRRGRGGGAEEERRKGEEGRLQLADSS